MPYLLIIVAIVMVVYGPALWTRMVMRSNAQDRPDFPGTGGELARHLLDEAGLAEVGVERTDLGDHYDPDKKAVRLTKDNYEGRSLTAVAVAAHEVGHALQDRDSYGPLRARTRMVRSVRGVQRTGSIILFATPVVAMIVRSPALFLLQIGAGILTMGSSVIVHLVTLPVEFDASFNRALPILDRGGYLAKEDLPAARRLLRAAALTYVSASLASLLNLWQWLRYLR